MQEMVAAANLILTPFKCLCPIICAGQGRFGKRQEQRSFTLWLQEVENFPC